jgi:flagellar biosynthesis GTPase FlhF
MIVQQHAIYESLKAFMLRIGYAQQSEQTGETWSIINDNNFRAMMTFKYSVAPAMVLVPTKLVDVHEDIRKHKDWVYMDEYEYDEETGEKPIAYRTLYGSSVLPSMLDIGAAAEIQLGDLVRRSHTESGLSVPEWNDLSEEDRDAKLAKTLADMRAENNWVSPEQKAAEQKAAEEQAAREQAEAQEREALLAKELAEKEAAEAAAKAEAEKNQVFEQTDETEGDGDEGEEGGGSDDDADAEDSKE